MFNAKLTARITKLETKVETLESQVLDLKTMNLASIDDNPPTVEYAFAINEIITLAKVLANAHLKDDFGNPLQQTASELVSWVDSIGK